MKITAHTDQNAVAPPVCTVQAGPGGRPPASRVPRRWVVWGLLLGLPYLLLHQEVIRRAVRIGLEQPDWSHALAVPFISAWFVRRQWHRVRETGAQTCWWGLPVMALGVAAYILALYPVRNAMLAGYAAILDLLGLVWFVGGTRVIRLLWFPICYLGFAVKISDKIWDLVAWRLQLFAARISAACLTLFGLDAQVRGAVIEIWVGLDRATRLNVAEACSGLRMLMALAALGTAFVYVWPRPWWKRLLLLGLTVPIAVMVNVGRVTLAGLLSRSAPQLAGSALHAWVGTFMVVPALGAFLFAAWGLDRLVPELPGAAEADPGPGGRTPAARGRSA